MSKSSQFWAQWLSLDQKLDRVTLLKFEIRIRVLEHDSYWKNLDKSHENLFTKVIKSVIKSVKPVGYPLKGVGKATFLTHLQITNRK